MYISPGQPLPLLWLSFQLQVPAVTLTACRNGEGLRKIPLPQPLEPFNSNLPCFALLLHLPVSFTNTKTIVSTEAAHSLTVSSEMEKSASPSILSPGPNRAVAVAFLIGAAL